jgi:hypothetical protein
VPLVGQDACCAGWDALVRRDRLTAGEDLEVLLREFNVYIASGMLQMDTVASTVDADKPVPAHLPSAGEEGREDEV